MKNNKKLVFALSAILIVAAIFIVSEKMATVRPPEHRMKFFPALEERHITAIVVNDGDSVVRLEKRDGADGAWMVGNNTGEPVTDSASAGNATQSGGFSHADSSLVTIALEKIVSLKKSELISGNPDKQAAFEVGDSNKSFVEVYAGKKEPAGVLRIGKSGPDWNSNYARLAGSDTVYLIPGGLRQSLFLDVERWRKKEEAKPDSAADNASLKDIE